MSRSHEPHVLNRALEHAAAFDQIFIATADSSGAPHLEVEGALAPAEGPLVLRGFFGPTTMANLRVNPQLALLAWDTHDQRGVKLRGTLVHARETALLDGYLPELDRGTPQVEHELRIEVEDVLLVERHPRRRRRYITRLPREP